MPEQKTIGQLMEEMRLKAGAREYSGHSYMDLNRFAEDTRHMIIFDTLTADSPVGWKGERSRAFLTEEGSQNSSIPRQTSLSRAFKPLTGGIFMI